MPIAEARIRTTRPARDLIQLSTALGGHLHLRPGGAATFEAGNAHCTLQATPGTLTLRIEARDRAELRRVVEELSRARTLPEVTWHRASRRRAVLGVLAVVTLVVLLVRPWADMM